MSSPFIGPIEPSQHIHLDQVISTQDTAAKELLSGSKIAVITAGEQLGGRGRFKREWHSPAGSSLSMTLILRDQAKHPKPYLLGMLAAVAVASVIHCQIQWPNDLAIHGKKVGGILTEMLPDQSGNPVPVIGIGINLNQSQFPDEISDRATSLHLEHGLEYSASTVAEAIVKQLQKMETPNEWSDIQLVWQEFDQTKGKGYRAPDGELATAIGINADGSLLAMVEGEYRTYLAADALFGTQPEAN